MRLIDADEIRIKSEYMHDICGVAMIRVEDIARILNDMPTIEPERKQGKWIWLTSTYDRTPCEMRYMCSECHCETILHSNESSYPWENFCPNCGSDMRGGKEESEKK